MESFLLQALLVGKTYWSEHISLYVMSNYYYLGMTHTVLLPVLHSINAELREADSQLDLIILSYIIIIIIL